MTTLTEAQRRVDEWINTIGHGYFNPVTNIAILAEEVGELAHAVVRRYGQQRPKAGDAIDNDTIADELADVLWVVIALANQTGTDLETAFARTLDKKTKRDAHRFDNPTDR